MFTYTGYALILVALMLIAQERGADVTARSGIICGVAGFIAAHFAPAFSLAPEVPGAATADIGSRQIWWSITVVASGIGMWLIAFGRNWMIWGISVILFTAPHIIGAPQPDAFAGQAPPEIAALFAARTLGTGLVAWAILGCLTAYFLDKEQRRLT